LYLAIVHHPVRNRIGEVITATIDHFDVFDASRLSLAYPLAGVFVVNPEPSQRDTARRLIAHGTDPHRTEDRRGCFDKTHWVPDLAALVEHVRTTTGRPARTVATSARPAPGTVDFAEMRAHLRGPEPYVLLVGKGSGLTDDVLDGADLRLAPIDLGTGYAHLSVRSAMAILLDRLLAP
jgi:tRNA (guanine37-N1)-methyltransferase